MRKWSNEWYNKYFSDYFDDEVKKTPKKQENRWMIKNSAGEKSASLTILIIAVSVAFLKLLLGGLVLKVGGFELGLKEQSASELGLFVAPFITLYFGRRWTDYKKSSPPENNTKKV